MCFEKLLDVVAVAGVAEALRIADDISASPGRKLGLDFWPVRFDEVPRRIFPRGVAHEPADEEWKILLANGGRERIGERLTDEVRLGKVRKGIKEFVEFTGGVGGFAAFEELIVQLLASIERSQV